MVFDILLTEGRLPLQRLIPRDNQWLTCKHAFHPQINQSWVHTPNCLLLLITLTPQTNISSALNQPRAKHQTTKDSSHAPEPTEIIQPTSPKLLPCPALPSPWKPQQRLWSRLSPHPVFCLQTSSAASTCGPACCAYFPGKIASNSKCFFQWHWPLHVFTQSPSWIKSPWVHFNTSTEIQREK